MYRVLDADGSVRADAVEPDLSEELALKIYGNMIRLEAMDDIFYNAQRQVRSRSRCRPLSSTELGHRTVCSFCFLLTNYEHIGTAC